MLPSDSFLQVQALLELPAESDFDDEVALRPALGRTWTTGGPFGRAWTPMLEVLGSRDLESGADIEWDLVPQFQVTLNTRQHVTANFGLRIPTENEPGRSFEPHYTTIDSAGQVQIYESVMVDVSGASGAVTVSVELLFQTIGYRWAES